MIGIYKIINPNGKIYIGQSINIEKRWQYYKSQYHNKKDKQNKLFNSLKKYGINGHIFEVIEECTIEQLNEREIYWGNYYKCTDINIGLNLRELGKQGQWTKEAKNKLSKSQLGKSRHTAESKAKISAALKGTKYTEEQKQKCSNNSGMKGKPNVKGGSKKGWKRSNDSKEKIRQSKIGIKQPKISEALFKPVLQYDLNNGFIKEWPSIKKAAETLGVGANGISLCCNNKLKTSNKYVWKFK